MDSFFDLNNIKSCTFRNFILGKKINSFKDLNAAKEEYYSELDSIIASGVDASTKNMIGRLKKEAKEFKTLPNVDYVKVVNSYHNSIVGSSSSKNTINIIKRRKLLPLPPPTDDKKSDDEDLFYHVESEQDIWDLWYRFFSDCNNDDTMHSFSLEKIGIIQCGYTVKMRSCLLEELYPFLILKPSIKSPLQPYIEEIIKSFSCGSVTDFAKEVKLLKANHKQDNTAKFISKVFKLVSSIAMNPNVLKMIKKRETNYCSYLIDPLMKIVNEFVEDKICFYQVGEYKLEAVHKEIIRRHDVKLANTSYNADGCHTSTVAGKFIELSVVEVSGSISETTQARFTKDHIKAGFGALALLQEIGHLFKFGSMETFSSILIYFIHILGNKIRLWSLEQVSPGVCVMHLIFTAVIPTEYDDSEPKMRDLVKLLWTFKFGLNLTLENVKKLHKEHQAVELAIARETTDRETAAATSIPTSFEKGSILKIKGDYIPGYEELEVHSSD